MKRIDPVPGEWIDRTRRVGFMFEGRPVEGFQGDTYSSALLANDIHVLGRSFKYHRPRGVLSAANHDVNVMFQVEHSAQAGGSRSVPNVRGDVEPLRADANITVVNTSGGVERDRMAMMDRFSRFLPVGFYYKAFHSKRTFPRWERMIRRAAGLGHVDPRATRRPTAKRYAHTDVLVIGAGPSGLAAAVEAAERGAQVLLADDTARPGGSGLYTRGGGNVDRRVTELAAAALAHPRIQFLAQTFASGYYADLWVPLVAGDHLIKVRARAVVVAQGAFEQPAVFRGNDLPGVMLASGAQRLMYRYAVAPASRVAILTANSEGYLAALDAKARGLDVLGVLDLRESVHESETRLVETVRARGISIRYGVQPVEARAGADHRLSEIEFEVTARDGGPSRHRWMVDGLWMSVGFAPANQLLHQAGARMRFDAAIQQFVPERLPPGVFACGKVAGYFDLAGRLTNGRETGAAAAEHAGVGPTRSSSTSSSVPGSTSSSTSGGALGSTSSSAPGAGAKGPNHPRAARGSPSHEYPIFPHPKGKEFVDFDEDLHLRDIANAFQEGFDSSELLKRYSTVGMGPSQGKHSNLNAMRVLARLRGESVETVGATTSRPMFHPVPLSHLAGRAFYPQRRTALHSEHEALGAVWMPAGDWQRPEYYARTDEARKASIEAEVRAVRTGVGLIDVGTLGKIEAHGAGAAGFLDRAYAGQFSTLKVGMTRYGLLLDESGVIVDDGVIARLGDERFYFTTTTGNSGSLFREFGRLATWWRLPVGLVNLTGHFSAFNIAGPAARAVLAELTPVDLSQAAFPYLGVREGEVAGVRCRLMRVGFVGEIGYEIHLPAGDATTVWRALMRAGERHGIRAFGVEAQRILRLEKGHIIVGQDTDGLTNPLEINAGWAVRMNKPFFVGQRSLRILESRPLRQQLVGFKLRDGSAARPKESHLIIDAGRIAGRVTSIVESPTLGATIGLALVDPDMAKRNELHIRVERGEEVVVTVVPLPFYDAPGARQRLEEAAASPLETTA
ncbi:MAG: glycine cleavage T C-terminal barrel domain-containing protein [Gammaproteobacteria bacterium]